MTGALSDVTVDAQQLHRFFHAGDDEVQALRGVSLQIHRGELVAVVGRSGSGKSTLLSCLAGLDEPDGGHVDIAGARMTRRPEPERARLRSRQLGILMQSANLMPHLSVTQNVLLAQRIAGSAQPAVAEQLLDQLGIRERGNARPETLSGGETARAGLAVALANNPVLILADEPTGELDSTTELQILGLLRARADAGTALLIASHSQAVAAAADRIIGIDDGRLT